MSSFREMYRAVRQPTNSTLDISKALRIATEHHQAGHLPQAAQIYRQILQQQPNHLNALYLLGNAACQTRNFVEGIDCYRKALALQPDSVDLNNNLGNALQEQADFEGAIDCYQKVLALQPDAADTHCNLARVLTLQGQIESATSHYCRAIQLAPNCVEYHCAIASTLLLQGNFIDGLSEYEWRWGLRDARPRSFVQPLWEGSKLHGSTILLYAEQGFGDTLQFVRYATLVAQQGARVIVECQKSLVRLLSSVTGIEQVVARGMQLPDFDVQAPLLSLPGIMGTTLETVPAQVPYLMAPDVSYEKLEVLPGTKLKVGIIWASGHREKLEALRLYQLKSCSLSMFVDLLSIPSIALYSLQVGRDAAALAQFKAEPRLQDLSPQIQDFADTAALISQLDLVISVDTAVAHLAGALGKPVWVLLPFVPDWRWLMKREDSPWYPTMRLFRQSRPDDWQGVFEAVAQALRKK